MGSRRVRGVAVVQEGMSQIVPGDPCPHCGAPLVDPEPDYVGTMPPTGGDYEYTTNGPIDLICTKCMQKVTSDARRKVYFDGRKTDYERR